MDQQTYGMLCIMFGCVVIPMSSVELTEQEFIQVALTISRLITIAMMTIGTLTILYFHRIDSALRNDTAATSAYTVWLTSNYTAVGLILTSALFSQLIQHSIPGFIYPLINKRQI